MAQVTAPFPFPTGLNTGTTCSSSWAQQNLSPPATVRAGELALWDTLYFPVGKDLANKECPLFGSTKDEVGLPQTNLVHPNIVPAGAAFNVFAVSFLVTPVKPPTDLERLALQNRERRDQTQEVLASGFFEWRFPGQRLHMQGSPLWAGVFRYEVHPIHIPANTSFEIVVCFGQDAPTLDLPFKLVCSLHGAYEQNLVFG